MKRGREPFWRPKPQYVANMENVLAQLQRSGSIYFVKSLSKTAIQIHKSKNTATLTLPRQFVQENGDKIEQWSILRAHSSCGQSGRPWAVRLGVSGRSPETRKAQICGGFYAFVAGNQLKEGDSLIFVLKEDARSEFEVYIFCGSQGIPLYPNMDDSVSSDEDYYNNHSSFPSPLHHQDEHKKAYTSKIREDKATPSLYANHFENHRVHKKAFTYGFREGRATPANHFKNHHVQKKAGKATPLQNARQRQNHLVIPSFRKQLTASNIGRSDRDPWSNSGQFGFPTRFIKTHGKQVQTSVKLQGIHEDSPTHVITCRRRPANHFRVDFLVTGWNRFVRENRLMQGQWLEFSLMADSYFLVRTV